MPITLLSLAPALLFLFCTHRAFAEVAPVDAALDHDELAVTFGLVQPLVMHGFNAAVELRRGRWIATYSHGMHLRASAVQGTLTEREEDADMKLDLTYSTGGGVGYVVWRNLYVLADVKLHHYEASAGAEASAYSTVTVGGEVGYRFKPWRGLTITPVVRYWPNVWDNAPSGGIAVHTASGDTLMHEPAKQGVDGLFVNVLLGWSFGL